MATQTVCTYIASMLHQSWMVIVWYRLLAARLFSIGQEERSLALFCFWEGVVILVIDTTILFFGNVRGNNNLCKPRFGFF